MKSAENQAPSSQKHKKLVRKDQKNNGGQSKHTYDQLKNESIGRYSRESLNRQWKQSNNGKSAISVGARRTSTADDCL